MSLWLDSRPLHRSGQGGSGERLPKGRLMCALGGSLREKQKIREEKKKEEEEEKKKTRRRRKKRRRESRRSEAA